ncbi:MAG: hypothetical protein HOP97_04680, partial [Terrabacter sp.]|nr:hypothetical protein [Terrabacter sp.]
MATGWLPGRLSEQGRRQASALGERRRDGAQVAELARMLEQLVDAAFEWRPGREWTLPRAGPDGIRRRGREAVRAPLDSCPRGTHH